MEGRHALSALSSLRDTPFPQFNQEDSRDPEVDGTTRKEPGSLNDCRVIWWPGIQKLKSKRSKLQCDLGFVCLFTCLFLFLEVGMELSFVTAAYLFNLNNTNHLRLYHPEHA